MLWTYRTGGIPDELFERSEEVPITKEEIRALVISKLRLREDSCAIDVGCGSGSITVELCLQARGGTVYAQDILPSIPQADAVIIGGSSGDTAKVIRLGIDRLKKGGRIVIDTILVETLYHAISTINETQLCEVDITQATIAKAKKITSGTMMVARNPITIISATKP